MRMKDYINGEMEWMVSIGSLFIVINLILFASTPLAQSAGEIFYMDLLMILIIGTGVSLHYRRMKKFYQKVERIMEKEKEVNDLFQEKSHVLGMSAMKELVQYKDRRFIEKEEDYQQKMNDLQDYITHTVHDLKVNLAVCEMVVSRIEGQEDQVYKLIFQIQQMKFRASQVLYITRANHYSEDVVSENVDIEQVVKAGIRDNAEFFMDKGISIQVDLQPYDIISDGKWVHYIITQIINNSSKYTKKNGQVMIFDEEDKRGYYLHIKDNGIGIEKEELSRIFDKGFTGSNGRNSTKSTGMGMYYAKRMADVLGIGIGVQSEKGVYTEFILTFYKLSDYIDVCF